MSNTGSWRTSTSERSKQTDISKVALADSGGGKGLLCEGDDGNCYGSSPHSSSPRTSTLNPTFRSSVPSSPSTRSDQSSSPTAPPSITSSSTSSTATTPTSSTSAPSSSMSTPPSSECALRYSSSATRSSSTGPPWIARSSLSRAG